MFCLRVNAVNAAAIRSSPTMQMAMLVAPGNAGHSANRAKL